MWGEACVTTRGCLKETTVQTDSEMLLTSVGNDSKSLMPRIRRNRKGSGCSTGTKRPCLARWTRNTPCLKECTDLILNLQPAKGSEPAAGQSSKSCGERRRRPSYPSAGGGSDGQRLISVAVLLSTKPACSPLRVAGFRMTGLAIPCHGAV